HLLLRHTGGGLLNGRLLGLSLGLLLGLMFSLGLLVGIGLIMVVGGIVWFLTRILMAVAGIALVVGVIAVALYFVGSRKK
ncbi:MAG: hypothetical protein IJN87_02005, partial [Firmicutes bacterium]|nr:hypothetical protein [Bacillota bacterium]